MAHARSEQDIEKMKAMLAGDDKNPPKTMQQVADFFGVTRQAIWALVGAQGARRGRPKKKPIKWDTQ